MFKYIISYDGGQLRDSGDFEWGLFDSYGEAEEAANDAKEEYMNGWDIEGSEYEDAREKVKAAYLKHNDCFDSERDFIELKEIAENDSWFSDNPDVVEVDELI